MGLDGQLSDQAVLETFLIENPDLERLELLLDEFNLFEALGVVRQELRHSDFLGFLLDPRQPHGLGDMFLTLFLRRVVQSSDLEALPFSAIDLTLWDLAETEVRREWRNIDLLILNRAHRFVIVIENKIGTSEHSNQLQRYREAASREFEGWQLAGIYLTPDGEIPSDPSFIPCSYALVHEAINTLLEGRAAIGEEVRSAIRHYGQLLQRHVVSDSEIAALCQRIYQRHKRALDLIYEHRPDRVGLAQQFLREAVENESGFALDQTSKSYIRFTPKAWDIEALRQGQGWTSTGRMLLFEFSYDYRGIVLQLYLGPGPRDVREHLFSAALELDEFGPASRALNKKWNNLVKSQIVVSATDLEEFDAETLEELLQKFWDGLRSERIPTLVAALEDAVAGIPTIQ
jgi:hypothetical protein